MPKILFNKLLKSKNFQSGMQTTRQIEFALFDIKLHSEYNPKQKNFLRKDILERTIEIYKDNFSLENEKIFATFEIAWIIGWKYHDSQQKPLKPGSGEKNLGEAISELG